MATSTQIDVRELDGDEREWEGLLEGVPWPTLYASPAWRRFLGAVAGGVPLYLGAFRGEALVGVLPSFMRDGPLGPVVNSLPWYGSHGACVLANRGDEPARRALLAAFRERLPEALLTATMILTPHEDAAFATYVDSLELTASDERIGQVTHLPLDGSDLEQRLEASLRQKTRNLARKALRQGFELQLDGDEAAWDFLVSSHTANVEAIGGRAKPRAHFDALRAALPAEWTRLAVALDGGRPVAALLTVRHCRVVEYLTPTIVHDARPRQPLSFLIWHELLDAVRAGCTTWNWGGTWLGQRSLHHFKAGWGAEDVRYRYAIVASEDGIRRLRAAPDAAAAYPWYYLYPRDRLRP